MSDALYDRGMSDDLYDSVWLDDGNLDRACRITHIAALPLGWIAIGPKGARAQAVAIANLIEQADDGHVGSRAVIDTHGELLRLGEYELIQEID